MKKPLIIVNFKTYSNATGDKALELAKIMEKVSKERKVTIAASVQAVDLRTISNAVEIPVLAQHFDLAGEGAFTGHIAAHSLQASGAFGSLLNHSEKRLSLDDIEESVDKARQLGLFSVVCADTVYTGKAVSELNPDLVAIEPPELIGGDISVCTAQPQLIKDAVMLMGNEKVVVGAGVKTGEDVKAAVSYGAVGVLVSSGVTKSMNPEEVLNDLVDGLLGGERAFDHSL